MFIITKKLRPLRLLAGSVLLAAAVGFVGASLTLPRPSGEAETAAAVRADPRGIRNDRDRAAYLRQWGWLTDETPASVEEILIPETFDASYDEYLALQKSQGFDLEALAGRTVKRYTYAVRNYPGLREDVWASLLIWRKTVVGGEIHSAQGDGFLQGLAYPIPSEDQGA